MKYSHYVQLLVLILSISISSCDNDDMSPSQGLNPDSVITAWLDSLGIVATVDASGYYYYPDSLNPSGAQVGQAGEVLAVFYNLQDLEGVTIASYQPQDGDSLLFKYASNAVFPVIFDELVSIMRVGETYNFILPPALSYNDVASISTSDGSGIYNLQISLVGILSEGEVLAAELDQIDDYIRVNDLNDTVSVMIDRIDTTFLNDVILSIDTTFSYDIDSVEYFTSGVRYKMLAEGDGPTPINGDLITIDYRAEFLDGQVFQTRSSFDITIGSSVPNVLIPGFDFGLGLMEPGERGLIIIPSSQAYRESAFVVPAFIIPELIEDAVIPEYVELVPPYKSLIFDVTRVN